MTRVEIIYIDLLKLAMMSIEMRNPVESRPIGKNLVFSAQNECTTKKDSGNIKNAEETVKEFRKLLETSYGLFMSLRDIPINGKYWKYYFCKTFEMYTKLWKFQKENRLILEDKKVYGLERWEIGEIASKIGQLYYHYYLRTSNTKYLNESMVFYSAIRSRNYMKVGDNVNKQTLLHRKLRYYARFVMTCLLLGNTKMGKSLIAEMAELIEDPELVYVEREKEEWLFILKETNAFIEALDKINVNLNSKMDLNSLDLPSRLETGELFEYKNENTNFSEAIIICCHKNQIRFSEITIDHYRLIQCLEMDPNSINSSNAKNNIPFPRKYMLLLPSVYKLIATISSVVKDMSKNSVALIYLSARGEDGRCEDINNGYKDDRTVMISRSQFYNGSISSSVPYQSNYTTLTPPNSSTTQKTPTILNDAIIYPFDIAPFMRKSLVIIVDSSCSFSFMVSNTYLMFTHLNAINFIFLTHL